MRFYLAILFLLLGACSATSNKQPLNSDPQKACILVAIQKGADSQFKQDIIKKLQQDYSPDYAVLVKEVKNFKDIKDEQFKALLVMDQLKAWLIMNRGLKNIARLADNSKSVYFISAGDAKWTWKRTDLKLVTSATKKVNQDEVYSKLKVLLDSVLNP